MDEKEMTLQDALKEGMFGEYLSHPITNKERVELIGQQMAWLRMMASKSQKSICEVLGCAPQTYSGYEKGKHEPPIESLIRLSYLYNVPLQYLVGQKDDRIDPELAEMVEAAAENEYVDPVMNPHMANLLADVYDIRKEIAQIKATLASNKSSNME